MRLLTSIFLSGLLLSTSSCATPAQPQNSNKKAEPPVQRGQPPTAQNLDMTGVDGAAMFREAHQDFTQGAYSAAIQKLNTLEKTHPRSGLISQVHNLKGLIYLLTKNATQAIHHFRRAANLSAHPGHRQFILYNLAAAQFDANETDDAEQTLTEIRPEALDRETEVKFHSLRSRLYQRKELLVEASREILIASRLISDSVGRGPIITQLEQSLQNITEPAALESLYQEYEDSPLADLVLYRLGSQELSLGQTSQAESHLRLLTSRFPKSIRYSEATDLIRSIQDRKVVIRNAVGILLPLKGRFAKFGARGLQAIEIAFKIFGGTEGDQEEVTLVLEDSGETPEEAVKALDRLFLKHHVIGVIGPLLSKGVEQVTQRAQELGLPLISLAQQPGVHGEYVFQSGLTPRLQAWEIARYAIDTLGVRTFAILHPRDRFGEQYSQYFWEAVEEQGGRIVGIESYTSGETDFRMPIDKLSGRYYTEARQKELEELAKQREELGITKRNRKTEKYYNLKPIVEYQAVFVPDEPKVVGQILPTFAYRDIESVKFLGISTWNSQDLIARAQAHAEGAYFVDAFFPQSAAFAVRRFVEHYKAVFGQSPGAIEALSYDAAKMMGKALSLSSSRDDLKNKLKEISNFPGVTGTISYQDGHLNRTLNVLTIRNSQIIEAQ